MPSFGAASSRWSSRSPRAKDPTSARMRSSFRDPRLRVDLESRDDRAQRFRIRASVRLRWAIAHRGMTVVELFQTARHADDSHLLQPFRFENHQDARRGNRLRSGGYRHRRRLRRQFHRTAYRDARRPRGRRRGRAYPLRADVHLVDRAAGAAVASAVPDSAMNVAGSDPTDRDASSDDDAAHPHGSFFGRRKGHKLRAHQADLIEHWLPRLPLDIGSPSPPDLAALFVPPVDDARLEIGFGGGEHPIAEARAFPKLGFI